MGVDLILESRHACAKQQALLFFELDLEAHPVPYLQLDHNHGHRSRVRQQVDPPGIARDVGIARNEATGFDMQKSEEQNGEKEDQDINY